MDHKKLVQQGYDRMAESYLANKDPHDPAILGALDRLIPLLPDGAAVLDLGCGAGVPVTHRLADQGYAVTGVDLSARQIELARQNVPTATFLQSDMTTLDFPPGSYDGVVAFYSIIHVPRKEQPALLARIARWLRPGGGFLATWATTDWEGDDPNWEGWGAPMWWSHHGTETNLDLLRTAGFTLAWSEVRTDQGETWLWALATA